VGGGRESDSRLSGLLALLEEAASAAAISVGGAIFARGFASAAGPAAATATAIFRGRGGIRGPAAAPAAAPLICGVRVRDADAVRSGRRDRSP